MVIKLANEGKTTRMIAKEARVSLSTIGKIINKATGDDVVANEEEVKKQRRLKDLSPYAQAFQMFQLFKCSSGTCHLQMLQ